MDKYLNSNQDIVYTSPILNWNGVQGPGVHQQGNRQVEIPTDQSRMLEYANEYNLT
ncbi:MAG: hypothetical protein IPH36_20250 [Saprospiraceae bacterium]|nr:hypothetical protein [Saprospiraceae bacterium]